MVPIISKFSRNMSTKRRKAVAVLTTSGLKSVVYDNYFYGPLERHGWTITEYNWREMDVDNLVANNDVIIVRSTWDYQVFPKLFLSTLKEINEKKTSTAVLSNSFEIIKWNLDKVYLRDLSERGNVDIVPTKWFTPDDITTIDVMTALDQSFHSLNTNEVVIKPTISATADKTYHVTRSDSLTYQMRGMGEEYHTTEAVAIKLRECYPSVTERSYMVQPFLKSICEQGEISLFYFALSHSHSIKKTPAANDFRVQEDYGGVNSLYDPPADLLAFADKTLKAVPGLNSAVDCMYARIDVARGDDGRDYLMELELIEPSLYFNIAPGSGERFAHAFEKTFS